MLEPACHRCLTVVGLVCLCASSWGAEPTALSDTVRLSAASVTERRTVQVSGWMQQVDTLDFRRQGLTSVADALGRLPGVTVRDYGGAGGLKTVAVRGFSASHTLVAYDGIPLGDTRGGQVDVGRFALADLQSLRLSTAAASAFPQSARQAAAASTVDLQTYNAFPTDLRPHLSARLAAGSFGHVEPAFAYAQRLSSRFGMSVAGSYYRARNNYPYTVTNGSDVLRLRRQNSRMERAVAEASAKWLPAEGQSVEAKAYFYDDHRQFPGPRILYNEENHERQSSREAFGQLAYRNRLAPTVDLTVRAKFAYQDSRYADYDDTYPDGSIRQDYREREAYVSAAVAWHPLRALSLSLATDYAYATLGSNQPDEDGARRHSVWQNVAMRWRAGGLTATVSLTAQQFANSVEAGEAGRNLSRLTPALHVEWRPRRAALLRLRAYYKETYRPPTFTENYYYHYGSTRLLPERARQLGAGLTLTAWQGAVTFSADAYHNTVRDKITAVPVNLYLWRMTNTGLTDVWGADAALSARYAVARGHLVALSARYAFQRVVDRTTPGTSTYGKQLPYTPEHSGGASVAYESPWVGVAVYANAVAERFSLPSHIEGTRLAPYAEWGAALYREFRLRPVTLSLRLDATNLFDKQYEVVARYPMPGRAFLFTVGVKW